MVMRWLMRGVCMALLAGVVGVWVGSYAGGLEMYKFSAGRYWRVGTVQGLGYMAGCDVLGLPTAPLRFDFMRGETAADDALPPTTLGFYGKGWPWVSVSYIIFPLWLPALLLVVLNGFVWRWTRRRKLGRGFPIEPAKKADA